MAADVSQKMIDIMQFDLLLKGLYSYELEEVDGKQTRKKDSNINIKIVSTNGILCEYAHIYYLGTKYNFEKNKEDKNTNVSREYYGHMVSNKEVFAWLNNDTLLYMCKEALKFRLQRPESLGGSLKDTLTALDLLEPSKFNKKPDYDNVFKVLEGKSIKNIPDVDSMYELGRRFVPMTNIEDTVVKTNEFDEGIIALLSELIEDEVNYITTVISGLYESGYQSFTPDGMLNKNGMISVVADSSITTPEGKPQARYKIKEVTNVQLNRFYKWLSTEFKVFNLASYNGNMKPNYTNISNGISYFPHYQARSSCGLYGLDTSLDKFLTSNKKERIENAGVLKDFLKVRIYNLIMDAMVKELGDDLKKSPDEIDIVDNVEVRKILDAFKRALTTAVVVTESKKNVVIKLKISPGTRQDAIKMTKSFFEKALLDEKIFNLATKLDYYNYEPEINVVTLTFMMNEDKYNNFPLFAYQAVEAIKRNGKPNWGNVIVGKTIDDKIFTLNLKPNTARVIPIIAGSRSGKGVMTLNFLANAFALGYPVFYLDCKSDMGATFYSLARQRGVETFTYDGEHSSKSIPRDYDIMTGFNKLPEKVSKAIEAVADSRTIKKFVLTTSYIKGLQLLDGLMTLRAMALEKNPNAPYTIDQLGGERVVFVWDEFEKFSINLKDIMGEGRGKGLLNEAQNKIIELSPDVKKDDLKKSADYKFFDEYRSWVNRVFSSLASHEKAEWGQSATTIFLLAQSVQIDNWGEPISSVFGNIITTALKVCGNGSEKNTGAMKYGSAGVSPEWKNKFKDKYFVIQTSPGGSVTQENSALVKGYFLLNELYDADGNEASCVKQLFDNLKENATSVRNEVTIDGKLNPALAFDGYMQLLADGQDVFGPTLAKSWELGHLAAKNLYGYDNLNDYMYDVGAFKSGGEITRHINEYELEQQKKSKEESNDSSSGQDLQDRGTVNTDQTRVAYDEDEYEDIEDTEEETSSENGGNEDLSEPAQSDLGTKGSFGSGLFSNVFSMMHDAPANTEQSDMYTETTQNDTIGNTEANRQVASDITENGTPSRLIYNNGDVEIIGDYEFTGSYSEDEEVIDGYEPTGSDSGDEEVIDGYEPMETASAGQVQNQTIQNNNQRQDNVQVGNNQSVLNSGADRPNTQSTTTAGQSLLADIPKLNLDNNNEDDKAYRQLLNRISTIENSAEAGEINPNIDSLTHYKKLVVDYEVRHGRLPAGTNINDPVAQELLQQSIQDEKQRNNHEQEENENNKTKKSIMYLSNRYTNKERYSNWLELQSKPVNDAVQQILHNEKVRGCEMDYDNNDFQAKHMIIETVIKAAAQNPDVLAGRLSGVLTGDPSLPARLAVRTASIRERNEEVARRNQALEEERRNRNMFTRAAANLDDRARQYQQIQQQRQQERMQQQEVLRRQQAQRQVQEQQRFSVNDYESGVNFGENNVGPMAYQTVSPKNNSLRVNLSNVKAQMFGLTPQNSIDTTRTRNQAVFKRANFLSRTAYGAKVYRTEAFRALLDTIDVQLYNQNVNNFNGVGKISMANDCITVNDMIVDLNGIVGGITGRTLLDIISFKELAKRYARVGVLEIDSPLLSAFCLEFEIAVTDADAIFERMFSLFPMLGTLNIDGKVMYRREFELRAQNRKIQEKQAKMVEKAQRKRMSDQFDAEMMSMTNAVPSRDSSLSGSLDYNNSRMLTQAEKRVRARNKTKNFVTGAAVGAMGAAVTVWGFGRRLFRRR